MPLGMGYLASGDDASTGPPQGGYIGIVPPKQLPQPGSSLGKYPWLIGDPPAPPRQMGPANQMGPQTNDFGVALGQKARPGPTGVTTVRKSLGPGKNQQGGFFGQPFKGGIF